MTDAVERFAFCAAILSAGAVLEWVPRRYVKAVVRNQPAGHREGSVGQYRRAAYTSTALSAILTLAAPGHTTSRSIFLAIASQGIACAVYWTNIWRRITDAPPGPTAVDYGTVVRRYSATLLTFLRVPLFFLAFSSAYGILLKNTLTAGLSSLLHPSELSGPLFYCMLALGLESFLDVTTGRYTKLNQMLRVPKAEHPLFIPVLGAWLSCVVASFLVADISGPQIAPGEPFSVIVLRIGGTVLPGWLWIIASKEKCSEYERDPPADHSTPGREWLYLGGTQGAGPAPLGLLGSCPNLDKPIGWLYLLVELLMMTSQMSAAMLGGLNKT